MWKGVIIEESLENKDLLGLVKIIGTRKTVLEREEEKWILNFHRIELKDGKKDLFVKQAEMSLTKGWYIHICRNKTMIVIFKGRAFEFEKNDKKLDEARRYGLSLGIIKEQMPFERLISDPYS